MQGVEQTARRADRKADQRLAEAIEAGDDALLHRARKAAKRARYAAELRVPVDKRAKKTAKHYKRIQTVLGDHQDGVVACGTCCTGWRHSRHDPGENGFTYGLLYAREQQAAEEARTRCGKCRPNATPTSSGRPSAVTQSAAAPASRVGRRRSPVRRQPDSASGRTSSSSGRVERG